MMRMMILFFFYWPYTKVRFSGIGLPLRPAALYNSTHKVKRRHSLKCIMASKVGCIRYLLFFSIWPCSLARSCRRCWCRSAAREGEPRGRQSSCRTALQRCWPALCCAPRNKRLAGYLMWCYNRYTWPSFLQRRRFRQHCSSFSWARWFSNDYLTSLHNMNRLATCYLGLNF